MRYKILSGVVGIFVAALLVLALQNDEPDVATSGPNIQATVEREFRLGPSPARQPVFSRDGRLLGLSNAAGDIFVLRTTAWSLVYRLQHKGGATTLAFAPDGASLYSGGYDGVVRRWDLRKARFAGQAGSAGATIWSLDVSPDGTLVAAAGEDKSIHLWDQRKSSQPRQLRGHSSNVWQAKFSPAGGRLASSSFDYSARIWSLEQAEEERRLEGHEQAVVGLAYRPDGKVIATSGDDNSIRIWRSSDGVLLRTIQTGNHTYSVAFSRDGRWLVSGGRGRSAVGTMIYGATGLGRAATPIHIWRVADGALVAALPDETDVMHVEFAPSGKQFVTANDNGVVRLWRLKP